MCISKLYYRCISPDYCKILVVPRNTKYLRCADAVQCSVAGACLVRYEAVRCEV